MEAAGASELARTALFELMAPDRCRVRIRRGPSSFQGSPLQGIGSPGVVSVRLDRNAEAPGLMRASHGPGASLRLELPGVRRRSAVELSASGGIRRGGKMADTLFVAEFRQACAARGCPFCTLAQWSARRYISNLLYEYVTAPDIHKRLADSRGFCNAHAWLLQYVAHAEEKDGMGVAIFYGSVVARLIEQLNGARARRRAGAGRMAGLISEQIRPSRPCLVCERQLEGERFVVRQFLDDLEEAGPDSLVIQTYLQSAGACMPHLEELLQAQPSDRAVEWLVDDQTRRLAQMAADLESYIRKHEVKHRDEPMGIERDSWVRVIEQCVGKRDVPVAAGRHTGSGG